jgi:hypothetical protein
MKARLEWRRPSINSVGHDDEEFRTRGTRPNAESSLSAAWLNDRFRFRLTHAVRLLRFPCVVLFAVDVGVVFQGL